MIRRQTRRAIHNVHVLNVEHVSLNPNQAHNGNANWVGTGGSTRGEQAVINLVHKRSYLEAMLFAEVKVVDQHHVREPVEILQTRGVLGQDLDSALNATRGSRLYWRASWLSVRGVDDADGPILDDIWR